VTQQFNTATSMGRWVLNCLCPLPSFERELIAERTRDQMAATRRKGKWAGGPLILGYDSNGGQLVVNEASSSCGPSRLVPGTQDLLPVVQDSTAAAG